MFFNAFDSAGDSGGGYSEQSSGYGFFKRKDKVPSSSLKSFVINHRIKYLVVYSKVSFPHM